MQDKIKLTVFTPTFNRAYVLGKLYESLKGQTNKEFIWLIVDDGSTDHTPGMISEWKEEGIIDIRYYYQHNQGKSMAHNYAVRSCVTDWFTCVDSDDYLTDDAVDVILNQISKDHDYIGYVYMRKHEDGSAISKWPDNLMNSTLKDAYKRYKATGDTMLVYRTELLKKCEFPFFKGERFVPESYVYDQLDAFGEMKFIHQAIYVCEYLPDGYTNSMARTIKNNPEGYIAYIKQRLDNDDSFKDLITDTIRYCAISISAHKKKIVFHSKRPYLTALLLPAGYVFYLCRYAKM